MENRYAIIGNEHGEYPVKRRELLPIPKNLDFDMYSSLMGLLATNGASLQLAKNWYWTYSFVYLRLAHPNYDFLYWLVSTFSSRHFPFNKKGFNRVSSSNSINIGSVPSWTRYIMWLHWNEVNIHLLPHHFEEYFSIRTLASWAIRNGIRTGNVFIIHVSRLNEAEKTLLITLIRNKLGYDSYLTMKNTKLAINNPEALVRQLKPLFHESQLYRLVKKT